MEKEQILFYNVMGKSCVGCSVTFQFKTTHMSKVFDRLWDLIMLPMVQAYSGRRSSGILPFEAEGRLEKSIKGGQMRGSCTNV